MYNSFQRILLKLIYITRILDDIDPLVDTPVFDDILRGVMMTQGVKRSPKTEQEVVTETCDVLQLDVIAGRKWMRLAESRGRQYTQRAVDGVKLERC